MPTFRYTLIDVANNDPRTPDERARRLGDELEVLFAPYVLDLRVEGTSQNGDLSFRIDWRGDPQGLLEERPGARRSIMDFGFELRDGIQL